VRGAPGSAPDRPRYQGLGGDRAIGSQVSRGSACAPAAPSSKRAPVRESFFPLLVAPSPAWRCAFSTVFSSPSRREKRWEKRLGRWRRSWRRARRSPGTGTIKRDLGARAARRGDLSGAVPVLSLSRSAPSAPRSRASVEPCCGSGVQHPYARRSRAARSGSLSRLLLAFECVSRGTEPNCLLRGRLDRAARSPPLVREGGQARQLSASRRTRPRGGGPDRLGRAAARQGGGDLRGRAGPGLWTALLGRLRPRRRRTAPRLRIA